MSQPSPLAACTVVSKNHLAYARVVHESFTRHHPGARFFVGLADRIEGDFSPAREPFEVIELEELPIPDLPRFCFQYDILELNCATKPYLMRHVLRQPGVSKLLYLDSDTFVYRELTEALELLEQDSIVLTPHLVGDAEEDGRKPGERHIMESGIYNAGFLGLRNDQNAERFLAWWGERVYDKCIRDTRQGLFVDQRWLDFVPGMFGGARILRNPSYNVGHWGLTHRAFEASEGELRVNGIPLAFFHFSGLDPDNPEAISAHQDRFTLADVPALKPLFEAYLERVKCAGYAECQRWPYAYARFGNGAPVPGEARRLYWSLGDGVRRFGNPFDTRGEGSFWNWMREEVHPGSGISRFWYYVHSARPELQRAFADVLGSDRAAFLSWIREAGRGHAVPEALIPPGPPLVSEPPFGRPRAAAGAGPPGVNVVGNTRSEKGMGEAVRAMVRGLTAAGVPHCVVDEPDAGAVNRDGTLVALLRENPYPVNLIHVNPVALPAFVRSRGPAFFRGRYNIGYWLWELPELPEAFHGSFAYLDEVWVSSDFCLAAVSRASPVPVVKVPLPLPAEGLGTRSLGREHFGLQDHQVVFLYMFDAHSVVERKNPRAVIKAFQRAFRDKSDVRLVLKVAHGTPGLRRSLLDAAADPRVLVIDRLFDREEVHSLLAACDCYVSLHRSEGFGLTLAEAMALGKPVIGTAYSANLDFMNVGNSLLVRYELTRLEKDHPPYPRGGVWAEPDVDHAAELMRAVYEDPDRARQLGERGRADVRAYLSPDVVGARIRERLAMIGCDPEAAGSVFRE